MSQQTISDASAAVTAVTPPGHAGESQGPPSPPAAV